MQIYTCNNYVTWNIFAPSVLIWGMVLDKCDFLTHDNNHNLAHDRNMRLVSHNLIVDNKSFIDSLLGQIKIGRKLWRVGLDPFV